MAERQGGIESLVQALSHDKRRQIISLLAEEGALGVTELRSRLKLSTGSLYHNLSFLNDYLEREGKKYKLNSAGMELYRMIRAGSIDARMAGFGLVERLLPVGIMGILADSNGVWAVAALVLALLLGSSFVWGTGLVFLQVGGPWGERWFAILSTLVSVTIFVALASISFRTIRLMEFVPLAITSLLPQALCSVMFGLIPMVSPFRDVVMLIVSAIGVLTSASAIKVASGTRTEYVLIFSFAAVYLGTALMQML
jgi:DNA-binding transcriptional ArsR family regulator